MDTNRDRVVEVLRRLGSADFDGAGEMLAPDFVQEYPYPPTPEVPESITGRDSFVAFCRAGMGGFEPYRFEITDLHETMNPAVVIAEYRSDTVFRATGAPYRNRYVGVFTLAGDGLITRWREYLNPLIVADVLRKGANR